MKVKEKKVELIELFYDLIYVYALSKLTMLIEVFIIMKNIALGSKMQRNRAEFGSLVRQLCCLSVLRFTDS